jgi:glycosyltransferase involved in cell wall biosynthesis
MPKVSILVPNYNYARFLDQRLGSIERQKYRDFEVILLDDASSDDTIPAALSSNGTRD